MKKKTHEDYLQELEAKGIMYVPLEEYKGGKTSISHSCPAGHIWYGKPERILAKHGCNKCAGNIFKTHKQYEMELFEKEVDANPLEEYAGANTAILHECINGHVWSTTPSSLLNRGRGCPRCSTSGFNDGKSAVLYLISFEHNNNIFYKLGITNRSVEERYSEENWSTLKINIVWQVDFPIGKDAKDTEKRLLSEYRDFKINTGALKSGNTETISIYIPSPKENL